MVTVAITSNYFRMGGAERQRVMLANGLVQRGFDVHALALQGPGCDVGQFDERVSLRVLRHELEANLTRHSPWSVMVTGTTRTEVIAGALWRFDPRGMRRGRARSRTWIVASHSSVMPHGGLFNQGVNASIRRADALVVLSNTHAAFLPQLAQGHPGVVVIPNGTDVPLASFVRVPHHPVRLGFLGRLASVKGLDVLLRALANLGEKHLWTLDVFGYGPDGDDLAQLASDLGLTNVRWRGLAQPPAALSQMDVMVLPSRSEAFPMALLEAMAAGVPVMASAVGSVPELLDYGRLGALVEPSVSGWCQALAQVLADPEQLVGAASEGMRVVKDRYTSDRMIDDYARLIEALSQRRHHQQAGLLAFQDQA